MITPGCIGINLHGAVRGVDVGVSPCVSQRGPLCPTAARTHPNPPGVLMPKPLLGMLWSPIVVLYIFYGCFECSVRTWFPPRPGSNLCTTAHCSASRFATLRLLFLLYVRFPKLCLSAVLIDAFMGCCEFCHGTFFQRDLGTVNSTTTSYSRPQSMCNHSKKGSVKGSTVVFAIWRVASSRLRQYKASTLPSVYNRRSLREVRYIPLTSIIHGRSRVVRCSDEGCYECRATGATSGCRATIGMDCWNAFTQRCEAHTFTLYPLAYLRRLDSAARNILRPAGSGH